MNLTDKIKIKLRGSLDLEKLKQQGLKVGEDFHALDGVIIDPGHCFLIEIGDHVTLAPNVHILAHDASMKKILGYTRIGRVRIGNNVFIGAGSIVLPNVSIESNTVIGAGSVVTHSLQSGIYAGNPCRKISDYNEWVKKRKEEIEEKPKFDASYLIDNITDEKKQQMKDDLKNDIGYIV